MIEPVTDFYKFIYNMAFNLLDCHHMAQDMAQQIFLYYNKQLEKNPEMDESYKRFWVIRVTKNKCFNYLRNNKRISFVDPEDFVAVIDHSPNPQQIIEENEHKEGLYKTLKENIDRLPSSQKHVLHLKYEKELPYNEIMKLTGYSLTKVKCIVHRAMTTLRKKMNKNLKNS